MTRKILSYAGWTIVIAAGLYFIIDSAIPFLPYNQNQFKAEGFWPNFAPFLLVHIIFGLTALVLGPFQFIPAIRRNYPRTHRLTGKIYLIAVLVAGSDSLYISVNKIIIGEKTIAYGFGLFLLAVVWLMCSGMAYWAVRSRNFVQHREWMVRSFVITCAFTTFRLFAKLLIERFGLPPQPTFDTMAWACWAAPLVVTEVFLQAAKIRKGNAALANKNKPVPASVPEV
jgi:uncharacterized membrane protein